MDGLTHGDESGITEVYNLRQFGELALAKIRTSEGVEYRLRGGS